VKDSNLRSFRDGFTVPRLQACDQRKRLTHNNLNAYSPQTADVIRCQPDVQARARPPVVAIRGRICQLSPASPPADELFITREFHTREALNSSASAASTKATQPGQPDQIEVMYAQNTPTRTPLVVWTLELNGGWLDPDN
jgi:hypothetical protein